MKQTDIESTLLRVLYEAHFSDAGSANLNKICEECAWEDNAFEKVVDYLEHHGLLKGWTSGGNYIITAPGIVYAEEKGIAPEEIKRANQRIRTIAANTLALIYEEAGVLEHTHFQNLAERTGIDVYALVNNLDVLKDLGYVESITNGLFKISHAGLEAVEEWRQRKGLADAFEQVATMVPQPRGRALQKLFAEVAEQNGWSQEEGVQTSNEEMDVIIHKGREYFLVECKWEKNPIEAAVVRELFGKLANRVGVQGIVVSMSGFTEGAVKQGVDYASHRVMLFFGAEDVQSLVYGRSSLDSLLDVKYQQLVTRRIIEYV